MDIAASLLAEAIKAGTPLLFATLGEVYCERSGVINLGLEGIMTIGALTGFATTFITGSIWMGFLAAMLAGGVFSLIHAFASISLGVNQTVSGLATVMLGTGISSLLGKRYVGLSLRDRLMPMTIPFLSEIPVLGGFFRHDPLAYAGIVIAIVMWYVLFKTRIGIIIRAVGEKPEAVDAAGVNVYLVRYICVFLGGVLGGLGGAYVSLYYTPGWREGIMMGRGWIALALTIFSLWNPIGSVLGAFLFGGVEVLQFHLQEYGVPASLLGALPYVVTIIVLTTSSFGFMRRKLGVPAALGKPYRRES
ncbi:MAG: ABC transporter permease [Crenarchaeota archaeon]|nr:ABC transporter permease [Thermoproteota archaeon]MDW8033639.1 ABC transporter permease [Nitrososphaerota archaeon]